MKTALSATKLSCSIGIRIRGYFMEGLEIALTEQKMDATAVYKPLGGTALSELPATIVTTGVNGQDGDKPYADEQAQSGGIWG